MNQINFEKAHEEIQTDIGQFTEKLSNDNSIDNFFPEQKVLVRTSVNEETLTLEGKIMFTFLRSVFYEYEVKSNIFSLKNIMLLELLITYLIIKFSSGKNCMA